MRLESNFVQKQQQKQSQKLNMTQQLSQSIAMLQFATADLVAFLEDKALENPLIEVIPGSDFATDFSYSSRKSAGSSDDTDWLEQIADVSRCAKRTATFNGCNANTKNYRLIFNRKLK